MAESIIDEVHSDETNDFGKEKAWDEIPVLTEDPVAPVGQNRIGYDTICMVKLEAIQNTVSDSFKQPKRQERSLACRSFLTSEAKS